VSLPIYDEAGTSLEAMSGSTAEPWERALQSATVGLGRGARVMLDMPTRERFIDLLQAAWSRAQEEHREAEYDQAASALVTGLVKAIQEQLGPPEWEQRRRGPQASLRQVPPESFNSALQSICPLWPFC
jgi:hypothetical protein